jgi:hypothetical protein
MTGSATKQSISPERKNGLLRFARNDGVCDVEFSLKQKARTIGAGLFRVS